MDYDDYEIFFQLNPAHSVSVMLVDINLMNRVSVSRQSIMNKCKIF